MRHGKHGAASADGLCRFIPQEQAAGDREVTVPSFIGVTDVAREWPPAREIELYFGAIDVSARKGNWKADPGVQQQVVIRVVAVAAPEEVSIDLDVLEESPAEAGLIVIAARRLHGQPQNLIAEAGNQRHFRPKSRQSRYNQKQMRESLNRAIHIIELLIKHKARVNDTDDYKNSPLHVLLTSSYSNEPFRFSKVQLLVASGADVNARNVRDVTPFMIAIQQADYSAEQALFLLDHGGDITLVDSAGRSAYDYAVTNTSAAGRTIQEAIKKYVQRYAIQSPEGIERMTGLTRRDTGAIVSEYLQGDQPKISQELQQRILNSSDEPVSFVKPSAAPTLLRPVPVRAKPKAETKEAVGVWQAERKAKAS